MVHHGLSSLPQLFFRSIGAANNVHESSEVYIGTSTTTTISSEKLKREKKE